MKCTTLNVTSVSYPFNEGSEITAKDEKYWKNQVLNKYKETVSSEHNKAAVYTNPER